MKAIRTFLIFVLTILFSVTVISQGEDTLKTKTSEVVFDKKEIAKEIILQRFGQKFSVDENGIPISLEGYLFSGSPESDPLEIAYQFFEENKDLFQMENPRDELIIRAVKSKTIRKTVKFYWAVNGVKVRFGGYFVHIKPDGTVYSVHGKIDPEARKVDTTPSISEEQAKQIAASHPDYEYNNPYFGDAELLIAHFEDGYHLIWRFYLGEITDPYHDYGGKFPTKNDFYYLIDAKTGDILKLEPGIYK